MTAVYRSRSKRIFSGKLGELKTMRMVLWSVLKEKQTAFGIVRVKCPARNIYGDIGVRYGVYVVGAAVKGRAERGYDAVKLLLSMTGKPAIPEN